TVPRSAGDVRRVQPLRHDALEPHLAGVVEHDVAVLVLEVLVELQADLGRAQQRRELALAALERRAPQVLAVELEQVEGEEEHGTVLATVTQPVEHRHADILNKAAGPEPWVTPGWSKPVCVRGLSFA